MDIRLIILTLLILCSVPAIADTVYLKDGTEKKGIVVENYHDRVIFNTIDGEQEIKKQYIKDIAYDILEQNLVKLGDISLQKDNPAEAFGYYEKAYHIKPDYKEAKDKFLHLRSVLLKLPEQKIRYDADRRHSMFLESGKIYQSERKKKGARTVEDEFKEVIGLVLVSQNEIPKVKLVMTNSPAHKAGIQNGDYIIAIWGRLTGYLGLKNIMEMILESASTEINLVVKREINIITSRTQYGSIEKLGFSIDIGGDGIFISYVEDNSLAKKSGLIKGDLITGIGREKTRYMPLSKAVQLINSQASKSMVELYILRDIVIWKEG